MFRTIQNKSISSTAKSAPASRYIQLSAQKPDSSASAITSVSARVPVPFAPAALAEGISDDAARMALISAITSAQECGRSSGCLAIIRATSVSQAGDISGAWRRSGGACSLRCLESISTLLSALKGTRPLSM